MSDEFEVEEQTELDEELGIDYHTLRGNPSFGFRGGMLGKATTDTSGFTKKPFDRDEQPKARTRLSGRSLLGTRIPGISVRKSVEDLSKREAVRLAPTVSKSWERLGVRGLGRHGCPLDHVDPFAAELSRIRAALALAQVQREATSEHNKLRAIDAYRARVLLRLRALLARRCG